jgi:hypothetical protein
MNRVSNELRHQIDRVKLYNDPPNRDQMLLLFEEAIHEIESLVTRVEESESEAADLREHCVC